MKYFFECLFYIYIVMITNFRIFENQYEYNAGDYIKVYDTLIGANILNCIRIIKGNRGFFNMKVEYICTIDDSTWSAKKSSIIGQSFIFHSEIERKSTPEEIKQFEIEENIIKYNL